MSSLIDMSQLAAPVVVEALDYETILSAILADLVQRDPSLTALIESDPAYKLLEVCAYREQLIRQRVNDAARSVMLAYAVGSDLDHLSALYGVERLLVDPGDPEAVPPIDPTYESDTRLRLRTQMAPESWTTAGSRESYIFHAMSASALIKDVAVESPTPGEVLVTVLSESGDGTPDAAMLSAVDTALSAETVRPLCDAVAVQAPQIIPYSITAELTLYVGPDTETVSQAALLAAQNYTANQHRLGMDVTLSGIYAALHQPGVQRVSLLAPLADLPVEPSQAAWCQALSVTVAGYNE